MGWRGEDTLYYVGVGPNKHQTEPGEGSGKKEKENSRVPSGEFCMAIAFSSLWVPRVFARSLGHGHPGKEQVMGGMNASARMNSKTISLQSTYG